jgi:hypothetical protein
VSNIENDRRELTRREDRDLRQIAGLTDEDFLLDGIYLTEAALTSRYLTPAELALMELGAAQGHVEAIEGEYGSKAGWDTLTYPKQVRTSLDPAVVYNPKGDRHG